MNALAPELLGVPSEKARLSARDLLAQFGLEGAADKPISQFSGRMWRRLDLAASLITRPPLIFLDEPTAGHAVPRRGRPAGRSDCGPRTRPAFCRFGPG